jgi:hypothetical protein
VLFTDNKWVGPRPFSARPILLAGAGNKRRRPGARKDGSAWGVRSGSTGIPTLNRPRNREHDGESRKMDATLTVPADFVPYLRNGLFGEWGIAAEEIAGLAQQLGSDAPDGTYIGPVQRFFTINLLLGEIGWKNPPKESDVVINLSVGASYILKGLKDEHVTLVQQLGEMPQSTNREIRDAASAKVSEFAEFITSVQKEAKRARRRRMKPMPIAPSPHQTLAASGSNGRRSQH